MGEEDSAVGKSMESSMGNLDAAEGLLDVVLGIVESVVAHMESQALGAGADVAFINNKSEELLRTLEEMQERIEKEIPKLVRYIPFERSCYGKKKDADVAKQKLRFAEENLRNILAK